MSFEFAGSPYRVRKVETKNVIAVTVLIGDGVFPDSSREVTEYYEKVGPDEYKLLFVIDPDPPVVLSINERKLKKKYKLIKEECENVLSKGESNWSEGEEKITKFVLRIIETDVHLDMEDMV